MGIVGKRTALRIVGGWLIVDRMDQSQSAHSPIHCRTLLFYRDVPTTKYPEPTSFIDLCPAANNFVNWQASNNLFRGNFEGVSALIIYWPIILRGRCCIRC